ncbi:MAG TPA: CHRD domain-containing protein [Gammaproteobacteria bacterium]|nr:CHRD domain-containing protein [Gammaproteobacteria bacterium]
MAIPRASHDYACGAAALLLALAPLVAGAADDFKARLAPVPIDSTNSATTTGVGSATARLDGTTLKLNGSFSGLHGPATIAQLHDGVATGVRGPAIADFTVPQAPSGSFTAELKLTAEQAEALRRGRIYVQIHSSSAPDGNLWGWLLP